MTESLTPEPKDENVSAGILAEAERLLGITGPKHTIVVDGHPYRLLKRPEQQPAAAAALFAEMVFMIRHWFVEHPEAAVEMSEYPLPMDKDIRALPMAVQMAIFLGLGLEIYAHKHGATSAG